MLNKLKNIKLIICDVDGVLTDGYLLINERGLFAENEYKGWLPCGMLVV